MKSCDLTDPKNKALWEREQERVKKWRREHKIYCKNYAKNRYRNNRNAHLLINYKRKDRIRNREFDLTLKWFVDNIVNKICFYCGSTKHLGCDRVDNTKGHTKDNVIPCCVDCNRGRGDLTIEEYKNHIKKQFKHLCLKHTE